MMAFRGNVSEWGPGASDCGMAPDAGVTGTGERGDARTGRTLPTTSSGRRKRSPISWLPSTAPCSRPSPAPVTSQARLTSRNRAGVVEALLAEGAIESLTSGFIDLSYALAAAPRHDVPAIPGLAIRQGLPVAARAAIAAPDRPAVDLQADGGAVYTTAALWTKARGEPRRDQALLNNRAYATCVRTRRTSGPLRPGSRRLLDLSEPDLDFVRIQRARCTVADATTGEEPGRAVAEPWPHLIDAVLV